MKVHSSNYQNTFIEVAEDCLAQDGVMPPQKGNKKTVANYQFEKLYNHPYQFTSDEVLFDVLALRKGFTEADLIGEREHFFSKGQPCFRTSPLTKRYGWGIHFDALGKMAIYCRNSVEYKDFSADESIKAIKAMRSSKKK